MRAVARAGFFLSAALAVSAAISSEGVAGTFTNPCVFGASTCGGASGPFNPQGTVLKDSSGNLFGTVAWGGLQPTSGAIFEVTSTGTYVDLHDFCSRTACGDGMTPSGNLIMDVNGALYGTTQAGGKGDGVVYRLSPPTSGTAWNLDVLYKFCYTTTCTGGTGEGRMPVAGLTYAGQTAGLAYDGTSPLYGTTKLGGSTTAGVADEGTVFSLTPGTGSAWTRKTLYKFCWCGTPATGGDQPSTGVVMDASGNLYGTARGGSGDGMVYKLSPSGTHWVETDLYFFCPGGLSCTDGRSPDENGLTVDSHGNLWGTTPAGGDDTYALGGGGVLYEAYPPDGVCSPNPTWCERVVYNFCHDSTCSDGAAPSSGNGVIITDETPYTFWGTTSAGGASNLGVLYKLRGSTFSVKHDFCSAISCGDGSLPLGGLYEDTAGSFFGVTESGGLGYGTVFKYVP